MVIPIPELDMSILTEFCQVEGVLTTRSWTLENCGVRSRRCPRRDNGSSFLGNARCLSVPAKTVKAIQNRRKIRGVDGLRGWGLLSGNGLGRTESLGPYDGQDTMDEQIDV